MRSVEWRRFYFSMGLVLVSGLCLALTGCDDDGPGNDPVDGSAGPDAEMSDAGGDGGALPVCALTTEERFLVDEAVEELWYDVQSAAEYAAEDMAWDGLSLVASNIGEKGAGSIYDCQGPSSWTADCFSNNPVGNDPFWDTRDNCYEYLCEQAGVYVVQRYFTMKPHTEFADVHAFTYDASGWVNGEITYDPNPRVEWRYDSRTVGQVAVSVDIDRQISVALDGGETLDVGHTGSATALAEGNAATSYSLLLSFPSLKSSAVTATVSWTAAGGLTGGVELDGQVLASLNANHTLEWDYNCISP